MTHKDVLERTNENDEKVLNGGQETKFALTMQTTGHEEKNNGLVVKIVTVAG